MLRLWPLVIAMLLLLMPTAVSAQVTDLGVTPFGEVIAQFYSISLRIVGVAVFIMFLIAGLSYIIPDDLGFKPPFMKQPGRIIQDAIIGTVLLFAAYVILNTINPALVRLEGSAPTPKAATLPPDTPDPQVCATLQDNYNFAQTLCLYGRQIACGPAATTRTAAESEGCATLTEPPIATNACKFYPDLLSEYRGLCAQGDQEACDTVEIILTHGAQFNCSP